jgi:hypothetical protein
MVARRAPEDDAARTGTGDALDVSVDFLEEHVMRDLRMVPRGRRRLIPGVRSWEPF